MNVVALVKKILNLKCKMLNCEFCICASKGPVIIMNQLKSIYNSPVKDLHSHPVHTYFPITVSDDLGFSILVNFMLPYYC